MKNLGRRTFSRLAVTPLLAMPAATHPGAAAASSPGTARNGADQRTETIRAMSRAAAYMDGTVSYRGGYVWNYLPDLSVTWGEMEAKRTMCWVQPPGTPSVGHSMLDAYHATGHEVFYRAAERTGLALVDAQLPVGGWNYIHDFAGGKSLEDWYETIGANGWRLEEFQHYYGNATFDDAGTSAAAQLILRLYVERGDRRFEKALDRAIGFVLAAQFGTGVADGRWPQRFPAYHGSVSRMPWPERRPSWLPDDVTHGMEDGDYTPRHPAVRPAARRASPAAGGVGRRGGRSGGRTRRSGPLADPAGRGDQPLRGARRPEAVRRKGVHEQERRRSPGHLAVQPPGSAGRAAVPAAGGPTGHQLRGLRGQHGQTDRLRGSARGLSPDRARRRPSEGGGIAVGLLGPLRRCGRAGGGCGRVRRRAGPRG
ncbi:pectate lyase [Streptomyces malaysiensis]|uniref:Pectate lyase n=1 Tax=Streptomyces malaysiensis subsp. samsunensis TaxID=459658 RepID=A0A9X2RWT2_STRMQ|nr:pectate lyase [Streptomyces samsunensis]MCQ8831585.1 pectate lyase [Streptomyces samsunensis]